VQVAGLYSHLGHSYAFETPEQSVQGLLTEFEILTLAAKDPAFGPNTCLTVGATPTATSAEALLSSSSDSHIAKRWMALKDSGNTLELHAGVYPFLDLQQLGTHARMSNLGFEDIGIRVLAEVASLYPERTPPEALVAAGTLALGREPCRWFPGWGIVSPGSSGSSSGSAHFDEEGRTGWIVGRISQEHGILTWQGDVKAKRELEIGERVMIWPTHACIAGAGFGWYLVVDGESDDGEVVKDVWVRCTGW
jgi:D-serine ammonia-lyase